MNEIRAPDLLQERYNTHFLGLISKLSRPVLGTYKPCSYSNNLASLPAKDNMLQRSLKVKIQNAINKAILADAEDRGVFVGGRRRNRKKKRNKNGNNKRKQKKNETKTSSIIICGSGSENDDEKPPVEDKKPLIEPDFCDFIDVDECYIYDSLPEFIENRENINPDISLYDLLENQENLDPENMPFKFFKKKEQEQSDEAKLTEVGKEADAQANEEEVTKTETAQKPERQNPFVKTEENPATDVNDPDGDGTTTDSQPNVKEQQQDIQQEKQEVQEKQEIQQEQEVQEEVQQKEKPDTNDVKMNGIEMNEIPAVTEQPKTTPTTAPKEKSPLINKTDEEREINPGLLCCTIL